MGGLGICCELTWKISKIYEDIHKFDHTLAPIVGGLPPVAPCYKCIRNFSSSSLRAWSLHAPCFFTVAFSYYALVYRSPLPFCA